MNISNFDEINNHFYNTFSDTFDRIPFADILPELFSKYMSKSENHILEIGSGAGALALWMEEHGHRVICIEPAKVAAEKARERGLEVLQMRLQDYSTSLKFDAIVAISSLIHIPRGEVADQIIKIAQMLKPNGLFIFSLIEGVDEGCEDPTGKGKERFFSKFTESEMIAMLTPFSILENKRIEVPVMKKFFYLLVTKKK